MHNDFNHSEFWRQYEKDLTSRMDNGNLSAEAIRNMSMEEYRTVREKLLGMTPRRMTEAEKTACTCMWCGEVFQEGLDEHEEECAG